MTQEQFQELKSLIQGNSHQISVNFEMIGRVYEEHGGRLDRIDGRLDGLEGRLTRVEVGQEQLGHDFRAVAQAVTATFGGHEQRLRALEG